MITKKVPDLKWFFASPDLDRPIGQFNRKGRPNRWIYNIWHGLRAKLHSARPAQAELHWWRFGDYQKNFNSKRCGLVENKYTLSEQWDTVHLNIITIPSSGTIEMNYSLNNILVNVEPTTVTALLRTIYFLCQTIIEPTNYVKLL